MFIIVVGFLFLGHLYSNNSIVTLTDIGENENALLCIINGSDCCRGSHFMEGVEREWYYPSGSMVRSVHTPETFTEPAVQMCLGLI